MSSNILVDNIIINNEKFEDFDLKEDSKTEEYKENDNGNQIKEEKNIININNNNLFEEEKDGNDIIIDDVEEEKKNDSDKEDIKKE